MAKLAYTILLVSLIAGVTWATQHHILVAPDNVIANTTESGSCDEQCYSLQHVLTHPDLFFTSNTTIELLPGQYIVNESFGNIVIEAIEYFTVAGDNRHSTPMIYCTSYGTLRLYFLNVTNVSISNIHFSHCNGDEREIQDQVVQVIELIGYSNNFALNISLFNKCTLAVINSANITVSKLTVNGAEGIGLLAIGIYSSFQLSRSNISSNGVNCMIVTQGLQNHSDSIHEYRITDSWFTYGNSKENTIASGITVLFAHYGVGVINLLLSNVTLFNNRAREGNLLFTILTCALSVTEDSGDTLIEIHNTISEATGEWYSNKGLVVTSWSVFCNSRYRRDNLNITLDNSTFVQRCIEFTMYLDYLLMRHTTVKEAPCTCDYAVSFIPDSFARYYTERSRYILEELSLIASCGSQSLLKTNYSTLTFQGNSNFLNNRGTVLFQNSVITFIGNTTVSNSTSHESPFRAEDTILTMDGNILFANNVGGQCGGLTLIRTKLDTSFTRYSKMVFTGNFGYNGGAMSLYDGSTLSQNRGDSMIFAYNVALNYGGAIFVDDASYQSGKYNNRFVLKCFYFKSATYNKVDPAIIDFANNTAVLSGNSLYGGWVDFCKETAELAPWAYSVGEDTLQINNNDGLSTISSNPSRVCLCTNFSPQCNITNYIHKQPLSPGQSLQIEAVAVGQRFGTVPSTVIATYTDRFVKIDELQHLQQVGRNCTTLNYTIRSPNSEERLILTVEKNFIPEPDSTELQKIPYYKEQLLVFQQLSITLTITKCPLGYSFDSTSNTCTCQETLTKQDIECYIQNQTVIRRNQMWINATLVHTDSKIGNLGVIIHHNCPFDYCKNLNQQYLDLRHPDDQCAFGRTGILCGECPQYYSHVFGTSRCKECPNAWTVLVLSLFILTGIGLVALLIILNLTVSIGTINGLIFYAHIVRANQAAFFPPQMTNTFLSWFIAWLNLDLGIEMCFFDGLDAYTKTWLQFLFPIYIWVLVIVIIVSSHYSTFAARLSS